jgi:hypothetical protein
MVEVLFFSACIVKVHWCTFNTKALLCTNKLKGTSAFIYFAHQIHLFVLCNTDALILVTDQFTIVCACNNSSLFYYCFRLQFSSHQGFTKSRMVRVILIGLGHHSSGIFLTFWALSSVGALMA